MYTLRNTFFLKNNCSIKIIFVMNEYRIMSLTKIKDELDKIIGKFEKCDLCNDLLTEEKCVCGYIISICSCYKNCQMCLNVQMFLNLLIVEYNVDIELKEGVYIIKTERGGWCGIQEELLNNKEYILNILNQHSNMFSYK